MEQQTAGTTTVTPETTTTATPTPAVSTPEPASSDKAGFDVASLLSEEETTTALEEKPVEAKPAEVKPVETKPVETKVEAPKTVETKPTETKQVEAPPVQQTEEKPLDLKALRADTLSKLEKAAGVFTEEEVELLRSEPEKILPKIAARIQLQTYEAVTQAIIQQLPAFLGSFNDRMTASKQAETAFTTRWPMLADPKFQGDIIQAAQIHKQINPTASLEQRIEDVGATLIAKHKLFEALAPKAPATLAPATLPPVAPSRPGTVISDTRSPTSPFADLLTED